MKPHWISNHRLLVALLFVMPACHSDKSDLPLFDIYAAEAVDFGKKKPCRIAFYNDDSLLFDVSAIARNRGGVSSAFDKHSFTVKLDTFVSLCGLPADDDWILNATYIDKTFMRHKLSYDLFRQFSSSNISSKCSYVTLAIESSYNGLYILMERMDAKRLHLELSDSACFIFKDPPLFKDPADSAKSESRKNKDYFFQKYPPIDIHNFNLLLFRLRDLIFYAPDSVFSDSAKGIASFIDLDNLIDWQILLMVTNNGDGMKKNFYLYRQSAKGKIKIAPWDYDHSFGRDGDNELNLYEMLNTRKIYLLDRLISLNAFNYKSRLKSRYNELKRNGIITKEHLFAMLDSNRKQFESEIPSNFKMWPPNGDHYKDSADFDKELRYMKNWIVIHLNRVDSTIKGF